jgi:hypothetical protein
MRKKLNIILSMLTLICSTAVIAETTQGLVTAIDQRSKVVTIQNQRYAITSETLILDESEPQKLYSFQSLVVGLYVEIDYKIAANNQKKVEKATVIDQ